MTEGGKPVAGPAGAGKAAKVTQHTQTAAWLAATSVRVADACFTLGGGVALYESSPPLQRRMRDLHAAAQHAASRQRNYAGARKLLLDSALRFAG